MLGGGVVELLRFLNPEMSQWPGRPKHPLYGLLRENRGGFCAQHDTKETASPHGTTRAGYPVAPYCVATPCMERLGERSRSSALLTRQRGHDERRQEEMLQTWFQQPEAPIRRGWQSRAGGLCPAIHGKEWSNPSNIRGVRQTELYQPGVPRRVWQPEVGMLNITSTMPIIRRGR